VKTSRLVALIIVPLLFACAPKKPEIPMTEVPARALLDTLELRRQSFKGLKAVASVEIVKHGRKRTLENVGIVLDGQRRLRMEAYGPLGQTVMALVWDGRDILLRLPDSGKVLRPGQAGLDQLLGEGLDIQELCAVLSGTIPAPVHPYEASQRCAQNGECVLEIRHDDNVRRIEVAASGPAEGLRILSEDLYQSGTLLYRARFDLVQAVSHYPLPIKIEIDNPGQKLLLTIEYGDVAVNIPIGDEAFTLTDGDEGGRN
jgi:hypothetical protein